MSFPSHFLCQGTGEGSTGGGILCPTEPGATKLGGGGRSLSRADIQGKSEEHQSLISTHRAGHSSVPLGTDIQGHGRSACGGGFVSALGWCRQPYLPCAAHTGAVAQRPVWLVFQVSAGRDLCPWVLALLLSSGEASEVVSMWDPWHTQLLALLAFAVTPGQENGAAPGLGIILLMVVTIFCVCILA